MNPTLFLHKSYESNEAKPVIYLGFVYSSVIPVFHPKVADCLPPPCIDLLLLSLCDAMFNIYSLYQGRKTFGPACGAKKGNEMTTSKKEMRTPKRASESPCDMEIYTLNYKTSSTPEKANHLLRRVWFLNPRLSCFLSHSELYFAIYSFRSIIVYILD